MGALLAAACLLVGIVLGSAKNQIGCGTGLVAGEAVLATAGLFYRYLKFYRQYGSELFTSYAETDSNEYGQILRHRGRRHVLHRARLG